MEKPKAMSNKFRYYTVNTSTVVRANNKTQAEAIARGRRGVPGTVLDASVEVERVTAGEAKALASN